MKKQFISFALAGLITGAMVSCNNEAENKKLQEADDLAVSTLTQSKLDQLNSTLQAECTAKVEEAAKLKFDSLQAAALASVKKPAKPAAKKPAATPPAPAKPTSGLQSQSDANKGSMSNKSDQNFGGLRSRRDAAPKP
jgi:hypothetical protein